MPPTLSSATEHSTTARPSRLRLSLAALLMIFAVVNLGNALHKGGDFDVFLDAGQRVIDNRPLYTDSAVAHGFIGPPFQALFFVPSAWIASASPSAAKISWYVLNLIALVGGAWLWMQAIAPTSRHAALSFTSTLLPWALLAIVLPAQTNFEHQNMNALLLCLTGAAAWALTNQHARLAAGCLIGLATALKAFPALLLVYLAMRREWTAVFAGALTAVVLTVAAPSLVFGAPAAVELLDAWLQINRDGGWPVRIQNQSLYAMASRLSPEHGMALSAAMSVGLLALLVWIAAARRGSGRPRAGELALVLVASVLLSPIAWDHYWVLMLPALVFIASDDHPKRWYVFAAAALLISGPSPMLPGDVFNLFRTWSSSTIAGLILIGWSTYRLIADARPMRTPVAHKLW